MILILNDTIPELTVVFRSSYECDQHQFWFLLAPDRHNHFVREHARASVDDTRQI